MAHLQRNSVETTHGTLAALSTAASSSPALLMIHGNTTSSSVFRHVLASPLSQSYRLIAFDLPGHGDSSDAPDPVRSYTQSSYADAAVQLLRHFGVASVVVFGWSLGGHVGIEMIPRCRAAGIKLSGLMIVGSPPIPPGQVGDGFVGSGDELPSFREKLSDEELEAFCHATAGEPFEEWMRDNAFRTDGRARSIMFEAMAHARDSDQKALVESTGDVPIAVINGKDEPYIRIDYIRSVNFANLWTGQCIELDGLKHAPFWEDPERFQPYLVDFMKHCTSA